MALPISNESVLKLSNRLWNDVQNMAQFITSAKAEVEAEIYRRTLDIPFKNSQYQEFISFALGLGITPQIKSQLDTIAGADVTISDLSGFWAACNSLSSAIQNNYALFGVSFGTGGRIVYTSTMTPTQRGQLIALFDNALAYLA